MNKTHPTKRIERFWEKVEKTADCWNWTGSKVRGYGQYWFDGKQRAVHRFAYTLIKGEPPVGLELDHLCRNRACVNPEHLEPVAPLENKKRSPLSNISKTHCKRGHEFTVDNTVSVPGGRGCRTCRNETSRLWKLKRKAIA